MHGRQKVRSSEQEEEKKAKEQATKTKVYKNAMKLIFDKRAKNELDEEVLLVTSQVLSSNPDIHTLWNIRKETLTDMKSKSVEDFLDKLLPKELQLTEFCLRTNPKSYGSWHHRRWLMKETNFEKVPEELKICGKYLELDDRNFHCWDYRRYLVANSDFVSLQDELDFTTEKISSNFSNFSSWHLRSKILPCLATDYLSSELDLIRNAVFTDPKDQSAWLYLLWLLKSQVHPEEPRVVYLQRTDKFILIVFNIRVESPFNLGVTLNLPCDEETVWFNPWYGSRSKLWMMDSQYFNDQETVKVTFTSEKLRNESGWSNFDLLLNSQHSKFLSHFDSETKEKADEMNQLLREELKWVLELQEMEPDIKWPVLASITLMRLINFAEYRQQVLSMIDKLFQLDPKRANYYKDLRSKCCMEELLSKGSTTGATEISLMNMNLTAIYYPERLCFFKTINLSNNAISNCAALQAFQLCEELDLSNNCIKSMPDLVNSISALHNLKIIKLRGNPVREDSELQSLITKRMPHMQLIT